MRLPFEKFEVIKTLCSLDHSEQLSTHALQIEISSSNYERSYNDSISFLLQSLLLGCTMPLGGQIHLQWMNEFRRHKNLRNNKSPIIAKHTKKQNFQVHNGCYQDYSVIYLLFLVCHYCKAQKNEIFISVCSFVFVSSPAKQTAAMEGHVIVVSVKVPPQLLHEWKQKNFSKHAHQKASVMKVTRNDSPSCLIYLNPSSSNTNNSFIFIYCINLFMLLCFLNFRWAFLYFREWYSETNQNFLFSPIFSLEFKPICRWLGVFCVSFIFDALLKLLFNLLLKQADLTIVKCGWID